MAQAKTLKFKDQILLLGDGATPTEAFAAPCGFTSLNMTVNIETNTTNVPDCEDPELPAWLESDEVSKQMVLGGSGVMDRDAMQVWRDWLMNGGEKNVRWLTAGTAAEGGGYWSAPAILTQYEETGERGQRWQNNIQVTLNGKPTWTDAA
ncbi:phage tail tube protein [Brucella intermedia]|uniref:phage tail tube protein n=1 Tax=Brucella intermedia TaxID=94625 RepID=UPI00224B589D|nr:phage tail tube protein [Brucella intermedia]